MFKISRWVIPAVLMLTALSLVFVAGCNGAKVTVTLPPATVTAPPLTITATFTPTTAIVTTPTVEELAAAKVTLTKLDNNYKTGTFSTLVATVTSDKDKPLAGVTVEWILNEAPDSVGDIVSVSGIIAAKQANNWATAKTDENGETHLTITAGHEGQTYVMVYVPGIPDAVNQKIYLTKYWSN